jgi:hypothetical protein
MRIVAGRVLECRSRHIVVNISIKFHQRLKCPSPQLCANPHQETLKAKPSTLKLISMTEVQRPNSPSKWKSNKPLYLSLISIFSNLILPPFTYPHPVGESPSTYRIDADKSDGGVHSHRRSILSSSRRDSSRTPYRFHCDRNSSIANLIPLGLAFLGRVSGRG